MEINGKVHCFFEQSGTFKKWKLRSWIRENYEKKHSEVK